MTESLREKSRLGAKPGTFPSPDVGRNREQSLRPPLWYRLSGAANRLVWKAPLPRRVLVRLSRSVYRTPPTSAAHAEFVLGALAGEGIGVQVSGGWCVDALACRRVPAHQTRTHRDLDLFLAFADEVRAIAALETLGYREHYRTISAIPTLTRIVLRDPLGRTVDLHPVDHSVIEQRFSEGVIGSTPVSCLSRASQLASYDGRLLRHHRRDIAVLQRLG